MEALMQYVWQHRLYSAAPMATVDGVPVSIIDPGRLNTDAGPDFFNAKVRIGGRLWAGDVEIHVRASDWHRHRHDDDPAYDSVILHVVDRDDTMIRRRNGEVIPQMLMPCNPNLNGEYSRLVGRAAGELPCAAEVAALDSIYVHSWIDALAYERIYEKVDRILTLVDDYRGDWEQATFITLARALGFNLNNEPLERLAKSLPLHVIRKHSDSEIALEALFFGQAGMLTPEVSSREPYAAHLAGEYRFYATKFGLAPIISPGWKMARTRPGNLPQRRIALLTAYAKGGFNMLSRILRARDAEEYARLFEVELSSYWEHHYTFGTESAEAVPALGAASVRILLINVVAPLLMAYGTAHGDRETSDRAIELLQSLPAEHNRLVSLFSQAGIRPRDAFTSQALIQLRRGYCEAHKCLYCRFGHRYLSQRALRQS